MWAAADLHFPLLKTCRRKRCASTKTVENQQKMATSNLYHSHSWNSWGLQQGPRELGKFPWTSSRIFAVTPVPSSCGPRALGTDSCCKGPDPLKNWNNIHKSTLHQSGSTPPNIASNILISKSYMRSLHFLRFLDFSRPLFPSSWGAYVCARGLLTLLGHQRAVATDMPWFSQKQTWELNRIGRNWYTVYFPKLGPGISTRRMNFGVAK